MLKSVLIKLFLKKEADALRSRLAEATNALDNIEKIVVGVDKTATAEVQALAESVLQQVLSSADRIRSKATGYGHEWEQKLYDAYEAAKAYEFSTISHAKTLVEESRVFFEKL